MSEDNIKAALKKIPYPVSVVTVGAGGAENGLTISWLSQVSFNPPMVMIAIDQGHYSNLPLSGAQSFVVNLLGKDQKHIAGHFAKQSVEGEDKIDKFPTREASSGSLILTDAVAYIDCELVQSVDAGGHTLFIGKVIDAGILNDGEVLTSDSGMAYTKS